ncbi:unnamed protein product, partial [Prorocentrum cordatum]
EPWIAGGDFQVAPNKGAELDTVKFARAIVVASDAVKGTRCSTWANATIDHVVVIAAIGSEVKQSEGEGVEHRKVFGDIAATCAPKPSEREAAGNFCDLGDATIHWGKFMAMLGQGKFAPMGVERASDHPRAVNLKAVTRSVKREDKRRERDVRVAWASGRGCRVDVMLARDDAKYP